MKKQTKVFLIIGGIVLLVAALVSSFFLFSRDQNDSLTPGLRRKWDVAQRLLSEARYEEAILAFEEIISIEPRYVSAYHALSEAYAAAGNTTASWQALYQGYGETKDESLAAAFMSNLRAPHTLGLEETPDPSPMSTETQAPTPTATLTEAPTPEPAKYADVHSIGLKKVDEKDEITDFGYREHWVDYEGWLNDHQYQYQTEITQFDSEGFQFVRSFYVSLFTYLPTDHLTHCSFYETTYESTWTVYTEHNESRSERKYYPARIPHNFLLGENDILICNECAYVQGSNEISKYNPPFDPSEADEIIQYSTE